MELSDIKRLNQNIYKLDIDISRNSKVIFIAALVFCLTRNKKFQNASNLTSFIDFTSEEEKPIDQLLSIAKNEIENLGLNTKTKDAVLNSLKTIAGVNTNLDRDRDKFKTFISDFITKDFVSIKPGDLFFETLYMEIDKKANSNDKGVVLTPIFAAKLMVELANLDYKKDVVADLCAGTGLFSLLSYSKMLKDMNNDLSSGKISNDEYNTYQKRLYNSIIANDSEPKMVTLCLANFLLKSLNQVLLFNEDCLNLQKSSFKINDNGEEARIQPTKAILNPPYEDQYKPLEIIEKNIALVKDANSVGNKVVVIIPPQKFGQKKDVFSRILNISTLDTVIKMQDDLFTDSGKAQPASIFIFNVDKPHSKDDVIHYYDFTDTGYIYLKDSGLVDKNHTYEKKKEELLNKINNATNELKTSDIERTWDTFYEVNKELRTDAKIDPNKIKTSKEEADVTLENITIKRMLKEKEELVQKNNNCFLDEDGSFEKYIINILSEV